MLALLLVVNIGIIAVTTFVNVHLSWPFHELAYIFYIALNDIEFSLISNRKSKSNGNNTKTINPIDKSNTKHNI